VQKEKDKSRLILQKPINKQIDNFPSSIPELFVKTA